uniref:Hcr2-p1.1 n=1 Tax=Solanum tuberosum TaxID=4113 RepID=M0ZNV5_SOLTU
MQELSKLISLDLSWNYIQFGRTTFTSLPHNLTNLEILLLDFVNIPFKLPKNFSSSLRYLSLQGTNMFGNMSDSQIFHLPNLQVLRLGSNPLLTGTLPNFNWSFGGSILELDFSRTGIFGKIPDSVGNLHSHWHLDLLNCHLSGSIPESIGNLTAIRELILSSNNFTGNVPSTISKLNKLVNLDLSFNHFRGSISESIGNLTAIRELTLSINSFTGNVPSTIGKMNNLNNLFLFSNNFEGSIPDIFANFSELYFLAFDTNNFTGSFPYSVATLTYLRILELQNNLLTGPLPSNISGLQELQLLDLSFNYFTGATPPWLSVQHNQLTGKLPNELKSNYKEFLGNSNDASTTSNKLLPKQVWRSMNLVSLNLENNFFQGPLHHSICDFINLKVLILARNNFSGSIPDCLGNSNRFISILDLRMNNFHGEIPRFLPTRLQYLGVYGNQLGGRGGSHDPWLTVQTW